MKPDRKEKKFDSKAVSIRRVAKVTAGGKRLRFSAMVVAGDRNGSVGVGLGRGSDTKNAIEKGYRQAVKRMKKIQIVGDTIPHEIYTKVGAAKVMLRPAKPGTGVIAGSSARTVLELCGIENVYAKLLGSSDLVANTYCVFEALKQLRNERILLKMKKMQARLELKAQLDKERKERESRRKKTKDFSGKDLKKGRRRPDRRAGSAKINKKVEEKKETPKVETESNK